MSRTTTVEKKTHSIRLRGRFSIRRTPVPGHEYKTRILQYYYLLETGVSTSEIKISIKFFKLSKFWNTSKMSTPLSFQLYVTVRRVSIIHCLDPKLGNLTRNLVRIVSVTRKMT